MEIIVCFVFQFRNVIGYLFGQFQNKITTLFSIQNFEYTTF